MREEFRKIINTHIGYYTHDTITDEINSEINKNLDNIYFLSQKLQNHIKCKTMSELKIGDECFYQKNGNIYQTEIIGYDYVREKDGKIYTRYLINTIDGEERKELYEGGKGYFGVYLFKTYEDCYKQLEKYYKDTISEFEEKLLDLSFKK